MMQALTPKDLPKLSAPQIDALLCLYEWQTSHIGSAIYLRHCGSQCWPLVRLGLAYRDASFSGKPIMHRITEQGIRVAELLLRMGRKSPSTRHFESVQKLFTKEGKDHG